MHGAIFGVPRHLDTYVMNVTPMPFVSTFNSKFFILIATVLGTGLEAT